MDRPAVDNLLQKAFSLAYFLHGDKETALRVVMGAMAKLEVAATRQSKRLYYNPIGRLLDGKPGSDGFRSKISFDDVHLLQRLVFIESEGYEQQKQEANRCDEEDLVIFFVKHLVRITTRRNSFYVTLGLSRLLYNYSTIETMEIYNIVVQDPERVKDDYYYRSRKALLMREIKERFGKFVNICRGPRGEERFHADDSSEKTADLVKESLSCFMPWDIPCPVLDGLDPLMTTVTSLSYGNNQEESEVEVNRIHSVLHPECFGRLTEALGLANPSGKLRVPHFYLSNDQGSNGGPGNRRQAPQLEEEDLGRIKQELNKNAERRKSFSAGWLRIVVDGTERGCFDLRRSSRIQLEMEKTAELIEVRGCETEGNDELLLASYLLADCEVSDNIFVRKAGIILENGQKLSINIRNSENTGLMFELVYKELNQLRAVLLFIQFLKNKIWDLLRVKRSNYYGLSTFIGGVLLLTLCIVGASNISLRRQVNEQRTQLSSLRASNDQLTAQHDADMKKLNERLAGPDIYHSSDGDKVLRDGERVIRLSGGALDGLEGMPLDAVEAVKKSLETGRLQIGRNPELTGKRGVLMGPSRRAAFGLIKPVGVTVEDKRPSFQWEAVPGALNYVVAIRNLKSNQFITSPQLTTTSWTPPDSLTRGQIYSWQVRVQLTDGSELSAPGPTEPVAKFKVLDESAERKIEEVGKLVPRSHLALATVYANCGLIDEASAELRILLRQNPDSKLARLLLDSVEFEKRRQHIPSVNSKKPSTS